MPRFNVDRRTCPGSLALVPLDVNNWGVCPYCQRSVTGLRRQKDGRGTLREHPRPR